MSVYLFNFILGGQIIGDLISLGVFESEIEWNEEKLQKSMVGLD